MQLYDQLVPPNLRYKLILEKTLVACAQVETTLLAVDYLANIVGLTTPDDVLDAVFAKFCIGK